MLYSNTLSHHGIDGQRWGVKNGPPYPLERGKKKKRSLLGRIISRKKEKPKYEDENKELNKKKLLNEGNATDVLKYKNELTTDELRSALDRIRITRDLESISKKEADKGWEAINSVMKKTGNVKDWTKTGIEFYQLISRFNSNTNNRN